jgi:hypothetical protein
LCCCVGGGGGGVLPALTIYACGWLWVSSVYELLEKIQLPVVEFS